MQAIQKTGSYTLVGYSAGGNLAFEVARVMEEQGLEVEDVILIDSMKKVKAIERSKKDMEIEWLQFAKTNPDLAGYLEIDSIREELVQRVTGYMDYCNRLINIGMVQAKLHLITAEDEGVTNDSWRDTTYSDYQVYHGQGTHRDLLSGKNLRVNAQIIKDILK